MQQVVRLIKIVSAHCLISCHPRKSLKISICARKKDLLYNASMKSSRRESISPNYSVCLPCPTVDSVCVLTRTHSATLHWSQSCAPESVKLQAPSPLRHEKPYTLQSFYAANQKYPKHFKTILKYSLLTRCTKRYCSFPVNRIGILL